MARKSKQPLTPEDQAELAQFAEFLRAVKGGPRHPNTELKALVEGDPDKWLPYLGVTFEQAREWGYAV